jgi:hypothetical protein
MSSDQENILDLYHALNQILTIFRALWHLGSICRLIQQALLDRHTIKCDHRSVGLRNATQIWENYNLIMGCCDRFL